MTSVVVSYEKESLRKSRREEGSRCEISSTVVSPDVRTIWSQKKTNEFLAPQEVGFTFTRIGRDNPSRVVYEVETTLPVIEPRREEERGPKVGEFLIFITSRSPLSALSFFRVLYDTTCLRSVSSVVPGASRVWSPERSGVSDDPGLRSSPGCYPPLSLTGFPDPFSCSAYPSESSD